MAREMKDTRTWAHKIPSKWKIINFSLATQKITTGLNPRSNFKLNECSAKNYYVTIRNFKNGKLFLDDKCDKITDDALSLIQKRSNLQKNDILFASISKEGQAYLISNSPQNWNINESVFSIRVNEAFFSAKYFYYQIINPAYYESLKIDATGSTFKSIKQEKLKQSTVVVPPLSEQQKIADFLDEKVKEIDNAIEKTKETIELYKKYKQAVITEAVTKGLDPNVEMKDSGIEWVPRIPQNWKVLRIANLYFERSENGNDSLPILLVSINIGITDHEPDETEMTKKTIRSEDKTKYKIVRPNDLVYNMMRAWQGAFGCARVDGMVSPAYVIVQPKCKIDSRYFEALLRTDEGKEEVNSFSYGVAEFRKRLYWNKFRNIKVPVPTFEEQIEISNYIDNISFKLDDLIKSKELLIDKLIQYKKSVIYEYVTGKKGVK